MDLVLLCRRRQEFLCVQLVSSMQIPIVINWSKYFKDSLKF